MPLYEFGIMGNQVLLVDDDVDLLATFEESLSLRGYDIITANNGTEAIEQYKEKKPCITFMDIKMPKMDGYETFSKIKEMFSDAKIVFVTGHETISKTQIARNQGLIGVLEKPTIAEKIVELIKANNC
jgi:DNA-binding NtrC family response regulator